jgi:uncharacterized protein YjaG (DUF416 family)
MKVRYSVASLHELAVYFDEQAEKVEDKIPSSSSKEIPALNGWAAAWRSAAEILRSTTIERPEASSDKS